MDGGAVVRGDGDRLFTLDLAGLLTGDRD
jgi:hypothetical protein